MTFWNKPSTESVLTKRKFLELCCYQELVRLMDKEGLPVFEDDTDEALRQILLAEFCNGPGNTTTRRKTQRLIDEISAEILRQVLTQEEAVRWLTVELARARAQVWLNTIMAAEAKQMRDAEPNRD